VASWRMITLLLQRAAIRDQFLGESGSFARIEGLEYTSESTHSCGPGHEAYSMIRFAPECGVSNGWVNGSPLSSHPECSGKEVAQLVTACLVVSWLLWSEVGFHTSRLTYSSHWLPCS